MLRMISRRKLRQKKRPVRLKLIKLRKTPLTLLLIPPRPRVMSPKMKPRIRLRLTKKVEQKNQLLRRKIKKILRKKLQHLMLKKQVLKHHVKVIQLLMVAKNSDLRLKKVPLEIL
jgi:hypothetical protein